MGLNGDIKGFNFKRKQFISQTSIACLLPKDYNEPTNPLSLFMVLDDDEDRLHVQLNSDLKRFFYDKATETWREFNIEEGLYTPGHSLKISRAERLLSSNFYDSLVAPAMSNLSSNQSWENLELQLIYYRNYSKDDKKYKEALLKLVADLKNKGNDDELRKTIIRFFANPHSDTFIGT